MNSNRTVQKTSPVKHWQRETEDALEFLLKRVYRRAPFVRHLLVYLARALGQSTKDEREGGRRTSFSPKENTGTRSALLGSLR